jgi:hypothetical protein
MNETGSGGVGAVSIGVAEPVVLLVIVAVVLLLGFGLWKLVKLLLAVSSGGGS